MTYDLFLLVLSQLSSKQKAQIAVEGNLISIEELKAEKKWKFSTLIASGEEEISASIGSNGFFRWQKKGAHLERDPAGNSICLVQEIDIQQGKYTAFRNHLKEFLPLAVEWRSIFQDQGLYKSS